MRAVWHHANWAHEYWWDQANLPPGEGVKAHYINMKIARFELGNSFLGLSGANGDVLSIGVDEDVPHMFKPLGHGAGLEILIDEDIGVDMPAIEEGDGTEEVTAAARRRLTASGTAAPPDSPCTDGSSPPRERAAPTRAGSLPRAPNTSHRATRPRKLPVRGVHF